MEELVRSINATIIDGVGHMIEVVLILETKKIGMRLDAQEHIGCYDIFRFAFGPQLGENTEHLHQSRMQKHGGVIDFAGVGHREWPAWIKDPLGHLDPCRKTLGMMVKHRCGIA